MSPGLDEEGLAEPVSSPVAGRVREGCRDDDIESSAPPSSVAALGDVGSDDGVSSHGAPEDGSGDEALHVEKALSDRISISPDCHGQQHIRAGSEPQDAIADTEDDSPDQPSDSPPDTPRQPRPAPRQPEFQAPPPFKLPDPRTESHLEGLPPAFSPQRKGVRYVPGGLAAEVQGWLSHIKGSRAGARLRIRVGEVREGGRMYIVRGRRVDDGGDGGEEIRVVLAGEGEVTGLGERARVAEGCVVEAGGLRWDVELEGLGRWTVACDWRVAGDSVL